MFFRCPASLRAATRISLVWFVSALRRIFIAGAARHRSSIHTVIALARWRCDLSTSDYRGRWRLSAKPKSCWIIKRSCRPVYTREHRRRLWWYHHGRKSRLPLTRNVTKDSKIAQCRMGWPPCCVKIPCRKVLVTPTAWVPYSNAANIGER